MHATVTVTGAALRQLGTAGGTLRAIRTLIRLLYVPAQAQECHEAVLAHGGLASLHMLWCRKEAPAPGAHEVETRVAAATAITVLLLANSVNCQGALTFLGAHSHDLMSASGLRDPLTPMRLVEAAGRLAVAVFHSAGDIQPPGTHVNTISAITTELDTLLEHWPAVRVEQMLLGNSLNSEEGTELFPELHELTVAGRFQLAARWNLRTQLDANTWRAWHKGVLDLFALPLPPQPHPLRALNMTAPVEIVLPQSAHTISAVVDACRARAWVFLSTSYATRMLTLRSDDVKTEMARVTEASGLQQLAVHILELGAAHAGVAPIEQLNYSLISCACELAAAHLSMLPLKSGELSDRLAVSLLTLTEWTEVPDSGCSVRLGYRAQSSAAQAAAVLIGSREGDGTDGIGLSAVCALHPARHTSRAF